MSGTIYPNVPLILLIVAVVAILIGLVSGLLIAYLNVPAFIATLGHHVCLPRLLPCCANGGATFPNLLGSEELGNLGFPTIGSGSITVFWAGHSLRHSHFRGAGAFVAVHPQVHLAGQPNLRGGRQ